MKNTIKLTSILLLAALIICPFLLTDNVRVAFGVDVTKLSENSTNLQNMVRDKLNTESYTVETLYGVDGEDRYTLVEGDNCYLIYYNELNDYMEYSTESNSVYFGMESGVKKVYAGPTYYMYEKGGHYYDLENDEQLEESEVSGLIQAETKMCADYSEGVQIEKSRANAPMRSSSTLPASYEIEHGYYFENLVKYMHFNTDKTCAYVAIGMFLSYYDTFYNDNIIEDSVINEQGNTIKYDAQSENNYQKGTTLDKVNSRDFDDSPGYTDDFHDTLVSRGVEIGASSPGTDGMQTPYVSVFLRDYFANRNIDVDIKTTLFMNDVEFCKKAIADNKPVIVGFSGYDTNVINKQNDGHGAVAYAYNSQGLFVNFGHSLRSLAKVNIRNYVLEGCPVYINFSGEKTCSNNYKWTIGNCKGTYCPKCNKVENVSHGRTYTYLNNTHHYVNCDCKTYDNMKQGHGVKGSGNKKICMFCGATIDFGYVQIDSVNGLLRSTNGSYMLPNGIVVLQDSDINDYINGTLKFYNNDLMIA